MTDPANWLVMAGVVALCWAAWAASVMADAKDSRPVACPKCGRPADPLCERLAPEWFQCEACQHWWRETRTPDPR